MTFDKYLTVSEEKWLLAHIAKHKDVLAQRDHAWIRFGRRTGARAETITKFTVGDADEALRNKQIRFRADILKGRKAGCGKDHFLTLTKERKQIIKDALRLRLAMGHAIDHDMPLFMSRKNQGLSIRSLQARIKFWAKQCGIENADAVSPHWLRHTLAMRIMAESTADDPRLIVMAELGHSSYESSVVYTGATKEERAAVIAEVG